MIDTLTPLGVGSEYSCRRSGCWAGHLLLIGKAASAFIENPLVGKHHHSHLPAAVHGSSLRNICRLVSRVGEPKRPNALLKSARTMNGGCLLYRQGTPQDADASLGPGLSALTRRTKTRTYHEDQASAPCATTQTLFLHGIAAAAGQRCYRHRPGRP